jgi:hypothetical protein
LSNIDVKDSELFIIPEGSVNKSLTLDALEYKRLVNSISTPNEARIDFANPIVRYSEQERETSPTEHERRFLLSPLDRISLLKQLETDYAFIAHEYLGREDKRLFYDSPPDPNEQWQPYPGLQPEKAQIITQFLHECRPGIVNSLHQRLSSARRDTDEYINEAKEILLPSLQRVLAKGAPGKKKNINKIQPTIYLHVGTAKTGTTALQNFFGKNLGRFAEHGYYYPETGRVHDCHHGIAFYWGNHDAFKKRFDVNEDQLTRLSDELYTHREQTYIYQFGMFVDAQRRLGGLPGCLPTPKHPYHSLFKASGRIYCFPVYGVSKRKPNPSSARRMDKIKLLSERISWILESPFKLYWEEQYNC